MAILNRARVVDIRDAKAGEHMEHNLGTLTSCFLRHAIARENERSEVQGEEGKMGTVVVTNEDITGS